MKNIICTVDVNEIKKLIHVKENQKHFSLLIFSLLQNAIRSHN